jgi:pimeloyl-ACP methyl ester carboxylesterase
MSGSPTPVLVLDHIGYRYYQDEDGRRFLPAKEFEVRLVTDIRKLGQATGDELASVVGIPRGDETTLNAAARFQAGYGGRPVRHLVAISEGLLLPAARLRDELGLPGPSEHQVLKYRDKVLMKEHLRAQGVRVPDFAPFTEDAALRLLRRHGAVVAKPRRGESSGGVVFLNGEEEVRRFAAESLADPRSYEVEERIEGRLYHIDSVVRDGVALAATAGLSVDDTTSYLSLRPYRDVAIGPGALLDRLLEFNDKVLACYADFSGVTHHEVYLTDREICFGEIGGRPGGGGVIPGFLSRTGVNLDEACIRSQIGARIPEPAPPAPHLTGYAMVYAAPGLLTQDLELPPVPWIIDAQWRFRGGDMMPRPTGWNQAAAMVTVRGEAEDEVLRRVNEVIALVQDRLTASMLAEN